MLKYTDAQMWKIMSFEFVEGKPYTSHEVDRASKVAVISESMRERYFGQEKATGKYIQSGDSRYQVMGVVKTPPLGFAYADIWLPYSLDERIVNEHGLDGPYHAILLARDKADIPKMRVEYNNQLKKVVFPDPENHNKIDSWANTKLESMLGLTHIGQFLGAFIFLACLFTAIPSINLINLNISRIMERSSEIGVRKAYGATSASLVTQFVFENIILTLIGGVLGFVMAIYAADLVVDLINYANPMFQLPHGQFQLNWRIALYCMCVSLLLGILSGVYPAYRMSRLHPVEALKGGEI
jgi:putative ABC transport system permease protein